MRVVPYWPDTVMPFSGAEAGPVEDRMEVAVIAGGFTGLALARAGASVKVLEAGKVVSQASGLDGSHVNYGTAHNFAALVGSLGLDHARHLYHAFDTAVDTVNRIARKKGNACGFRRSSRIKLAAKPGLYETIARSFGLLQQDADRRCG